MSREKAEYSFDLQGVRRLYKKKKFSDIQRGQHTRKLNSIVLLPLQNIQKRIYEAGLRLSLGNDQY